MRTEEQLRKQAEKLERLSREHFDTAHRLAAEGRNSAASKHSVDGGFWARAAAEIRELLQGKKK